MVSVSVSKKKIYQKSIGIGFEKNLVSEKVSVSVSQNFGIEKSIGFGIGKFWYRKKVLNSVLFRFWVSSHTDGEGIIPSSGDVLFCYLNLSANVIFVTDTVYKQYVQCTHVSSYTRKHILDSCIPANFRIHSPCPEFFVAICATIPVQLF